jgi:hypothetical protein
VEFILTPNAIFCKQITSDTKIKSKKSIISPAKQRMKPKTDARLEFFLILCQDVGSKVHSMLDYSIITDSQIITDSRI